MDDHKIYIDPYRDNTGADPACTAADLILSCKVSGRRDEGGRFLPRCQWAGKGKLAVWWYLIFSWVSEWTDGIGFPVIWDPCHESPEETEEP